MGNLNRPNSPVITWTATFTKQIYDPRVPIPQEEDTELNTNNLPERLFGHPFHTVCLFERTCDRVRLPRLMWFAFSPPTLCWIEVRSSMDGSNSSPRITDKRSSSRMDFAHPALASMRGEKFILQLVELVTLNKFVKLSKLSEPVELFKLGQLVLAMVLEVPVKQKARRTRRFVGGITSDEQTMGDGQ
ncbi:hypothetical protein FS749_004734 [Ceratobasidium sp. UAMH 11750]|nr:hypothetical protein FS749_004734 [Ceratobasidium sp. UAMH 11750]